MEIGIEPTAQSTEKFKHILEFTQISESSLATRAAA